MDLKLSFNDLVMLYRSLSSLDFDCLAASLETAGVETNGQMFEWDKLSLLSRVLELMYKMRKLPF